MESFNILSIVVGILNIVVGIYFFILAFLMKKRQQKWTIWLLGGVVFVISGVAQLLTVIC
jgi:uncharacterized membrane protein HdeD (DUF308 family)